MVKSVAIRQAVSVSQPQAFQKCQFKIIRAEITTEIKYSGFFGYFVPPALLADFVQNELLLPPEAKNYE